MNCVTAVDGKPVASWMEMRWALVDAIVDKRDARLDVRQSEGGQVGAIVPASALAGLDVDSDFTGALGLDIWRPRAGVEQVVEGGPAARAGLQRRRRRHRHRRCAGHRRHRPGQGGARLDGRPLAVTFSAPAGSGP